MAGQRILRGAIVLHRWLGIGLGLMMVVWCLSGVVMMYVPYPSLTAEQRLAALEPLALAGCCKASADALADDDRVERFSLEMLVGRPVLRFVRSSGATALVDLLDGHLRNGVNDVEAASVAAAFRHGPAIAVTLEKIHDDAWTMWGIADSDRPLYRAALHDPSRTEIYVSATSGAVVQTTTASQRFWNRLGSIPHWLYFVSLRRHSVLWTEIVVWASLLGTLLALLGVCVGAARFERERLSPYRGLLFWHHVPGIFFGLFALSWVASGFASMSPWGLLDAKGNAVERAALEGEPPRGADVKAAVAALALAPLTPDVVSLESSRLGGALYVVASTGGRSRTRFDASGRRAPLGAGETARIAQTLSKNPTASAALLEGEDAYYFTHRTPVALPVYRVIADDAERTRYYVDAVSGTILRKVDANTRRYRWLHEAAHRLDFAPRLRARPVWDFVMLALMSGVIAVAGTGAWLGLRRVSGALSRALRRAASRQRPAAPRAG